LEGNFDFQLLLRNVKCVFQILLWNSLYPARQEETAKARGINKDTKDNKILKVSLLFLKGKENTK